METLDGTFAEQVYRPVKIDVFRRVWEERGIKRSERFLVLYDDSGGSVKIEDRRR